MWCRAEVRLSHLNSGSKLFPVLSTPIKTHDYANTYTLPQFAFYSNMSGHGMSAASLVPMEASRKACFHLTDTAPSLDLAQSQLSTSQWQIILPCFKGVQAVVSVTECVWYLDQWIAMTSSQGCHSAFCHLTGFSLWRWRNNETAYLFGEEMPTF